MNKKIKKFGKNVNKFLEIVATIVTITGIGFIGIWQPIKYKIPYFERKELLKNVEELKTWQSREFVINALGIPQNINEI